MTNELPQRFWDKVVKTPTCWFWTGAKERTGHAKTFLGRKTCYAHRVLFNIVRGDTYGKQLVNECGNTNCINPFHWEIQETRQQIEAFIPPTVSQRFWQKVDRSGDCWNWTGGTTAFGHGCFKINGKTALAHRVVYQFVNGEIPQNNYICHTCDNPSCVNPLHLYTGTAKDNAVDAAKKLRLPSRKLSEKDVREIRQRYKAGNISQKKLGDIYGVSESTIHEIIHRKTWKWLN